MSVYMVTCPDHNLGHGTLDTKAKIRLQASPGPAIARDQKVFWTLNDQGQCLLAKCSFKKLPAGAKKGREPVCS